MAILEALDAHRPAGWLRADSRIRNLGGEARTNIAKVLTDFKATLETRPIRRTQIGPDDRLIIWLCRAGAEPPFEDVRHHGEVTCIAANVSNVPVLQLSFDPAGSIVALSCPIIRAPSVLQTNYEALFREAEVQRTKLAFNE